MAYHLIVESPLWKRYLPRVRSLSRKAVAAVYTAEKISAERELSLVFADDAFMRELNKNYRGKDMPTNVLSFPAKEDGYLGDIIVAFETIQREAEEQSKTLQHHLTHLLVHGVLHLLGYDHEREEDTHIMENKEVKILAGLGIKNPY